MVFSVFLKRWMNDTKRDNVADGAKGDKPKRNEAYKSVNEFKNVLNLMDLLSL